VSAIRVLHVIRKMDRGGAETMLMNLMRRIPREEAAFDYLVHTDDHGDYDDEIAGLGGSIWRLPAYNVANFFHYKKACRELMASIGHFDIVHGHQGSCAPIYLSEAKRAGFLTIAHSHNADGAIPPLQMAAFNMISHPVRGVADYYLGCSMQAGLDRFGKKIVDSDRFSLLPNGIDSKVFAFSEEARKAIRDELGIGSEPVIGTVGRLTRQKNHTFLLEIFSRMLEVDHNIKLVIVGRGELEDDLRQKCDLLGLSSNVKMLGVRKDVPALMSAFDAFILPSHAEGLPLVGVEAQAAGLPCFFSTGVPRDVAISDTVTFLDLESGAKHWSDAIWAGISNASAWNRFDRGRVIRESDYDIASSARKLVDIYRMCIERFKEA